MSSRRPARPDLRSLATRFIVLLAVWWAAAEGVLYDPGLALLLIAAATAASATLSPPAQWRIAIGRLPAFAAWFVGRSASAGVDVALRAFRPSMRIQPGTFEYPLRLPGTAPQVFFITVVSLIPGTLSVRRLERSLIVHALDEREDVARELAELERRVGALFVPVERDERD